MAHRQFVIKSLSALHSKSFILLEHEKFSQPSKFHCFPNQIKQSFIHKLSWNVSQVPFSITSFTHIQNARHKEILAHKTSKIRAEKKTTENAVIIASLEV